jgi:hypothetical protein
MCLFACEQISLVIPSLIALTTNTLTAVMSSYSRSLSVESTCTVLSCMSEEFMEMYRNDSLNTQVLIDDLLVNTIREKGRDHQRLRTASNKYRLDKLLDAMLIHAPTEGGKRYVAIALLIAHQKGGDAIVSVAQAWMDHLFLQSEFSIGSTKHY